MLKSYGRWAPVLKVVHVQIRKLQLEENWLAAHWFDALQNLERLEETQEMTLEEYVETGLNMKWEAALGLESPVHFTTTKTIKPITVKMVSIGKGDHQSEEKEEEGDGKDEKATDESEEPDEKMSSMKRFRTACETKTKGLCGRLTINFHERHHSLLGIGGEDQKMEAKEANSDKANGTSSSAAAPSSSFPSSQTTPTTKPDESTAADVRICAEMIAAACIKMAAISQSTYQLKSGSSSGEDGDDETDWKQPLIPKRRVLQKKSQKEARKSEKKSEPPAPVCNHPPDAKWQVNRHGNMEVFNYCCRTKKLVVIEGVPKNSCNIWKVMPQVCDSCNRRIKYVEYNGKVVELKDVVTGTLNYIW